MVVDQLERLAADYTVVFPVHPRTAAEMHARGLGRTDRRLRVLNAIGYVEFLSLVSDAAAVLTDSGGVQEETTFLGIPCFTLRANTERPITCSLGTNTVLGLAPERIEELPDLIAQHEGRERAVPPFWDGRAAERVIDVLASTPLGGSARVRLSGSLA